MALGDKQREQLGADVTGLLDDPSLALDSASVFIARDFAPHEWAAYTVGTYIGSAASSFVTDHIVKRAVDLRPETPLKEIFSSERSPLKPSKRNPLGHLVAGTTIAASNDLVSVVQIALPASEKHNAAEISRYFRSRHKALGRLLLDAHRQIGAEPLDEALRVMPPTTPNMVVIVIDHVDSTELAETNYPELKSNISRVKKQCLDAIYDLDGAVATGNGDGNNYVVEIPKAMRHDPAFVKRFTDDVAERLKALQKDRSIRLTYKPGYVTTEKDGALTSPVFWELHKQLKTKAKPSRPTLNG